MDLPFILLWRFILVLAAGRDISFRFLFAPPGNPETVKFWILSEIRFVGPSWPATDRHRLAAGQAAGSGGLRTGTRAGTGFGFIVGFV